MRQWYLVHTKVGQERHVAAQLYQRGIEVYLPLVWINPVAPQSLRHRPYFPAYLFARLEPAQIGAGFVRWATGMLGVVAQDDQPVVVSDDFMAALRHRLGRIRAITGVFDDCPPTDINLPAHGPFAGFEGIFALHLDGAERARLLLACVRYQLVAGAGRDLVTRD